MNDLGEALKNLAVDCAKAEAQQAGAGRHSKMVQVFHGLCRWRLQTWT